MTDDNQVHVGSTFVGLVLFALIVYSLTVPHYKFAGLNTILLVVLALGNKALN